MQRKLECDQKYWLLHVMGCSLWLSKSEAFLGSKQPIFSAPCLILLPSKLPLSDLEVDKIFNGMLKVLETDLDKIAVAWIKDPNFSKNQQNIRQEIKKWAPKTVLVMGEKVAQAILNKNDALDILRAETRWMLDSAIALQVTYDPVFLKEFPEHKKKAYQDLLRFKECVKTTRAV